MASRSVVTVQATCTAIGALAASAYVGSTGALYLGKFAVVYPLMQLELGIVVFIASLVWALLVTSLLGFFEEAPGKREGAIFGPMTLGCIIGTLLAFFLGAGREFAQQGIQNHSPMFDPVLAILALFGFLVAFWPRPVPSQTIRA